VKILSRQRRWQKVKAAQGLCCQCGRPRLGAILCLECRQKQSAWNRNKRGATQWTPGSKGRVPLVHKVMGYKTRYEEKLEAAILKLQARLQKLEAELARLRGERLALGAQLSTVEVGA
jgi:hypothetical protein